MPSSFYLEQQNLWWEQPTRIIADSKIIELEQQPYQYYHQLLKDFPLDTHGIMTVRGPRQIGKTTLIKCIIKRLLTKETITPENIFYYSCEATKDFQELIAILREYFDTYGHKNTQHLYVFLDEVSFVAEWQRAVKLFAESEYGKRTLFLLTGSSTVDLEFSSERLPGRRGNLKEEDVLFLPLDFAQFLYLVKPEAKEWQGKEQFHLQHIRPLFKDYLITGGFPSNINEFYTKQLISSTTYKIYFEWISGDMHKLGKSDVLTEKIVEKLQTSLTTPLSYYAIAKETSLASHVTAFEYLDYLERLFALFRVDCFIIPQKRTDFKKNHKFYFYDQFILFMFLAKTRDLIDQAFNLTKSKLNDGLFASQLIENIVAAHLKKSYTHLYYGKLGNKEIDFVGFKYGQYHYFEIKYQNNVDPREFSYFTKEFPKETLTVVTKNTSYEKKHLRLIPLERFLLT